MDMIEMAREIGKVLQQDERFLKATAQAQVVNESEDLRRMVGEFEDLRGRLDAAAADNPAEHSELIQSLNEQMRLQYEAINAHPLMTQYEASRKELERAVNFIIRIITGAANGEDPATIQEEIDCTGSCSTCGGCH